MAREGPAWESQVAAWLFPFLFQEHSPVTLDATIKEAPVILGYDAATNFLTEHILRDLNSTLSQ